MRATAEVPCLSPYVPHVLIIDDEPTIRSTLTRFFEREGWSVVACADAQAGMEEVERADRSPFAMILCDARLPGVSGAQFHETLRSIAPALAERLVVITGDPFGVSVPTTERGSLPMLEKPFEFDVLRKLMRERANEPGE
jgi:DNA-binding response OmpR family regulator